MPVPGTGRASECQLLRAEPGEPSHPRWPEADRGVAAVAARDAVAYGRGGPDGQGQIEGEHSIQQEGGG